MAMAKSSKNNDDKKKKKESKALKSLKADQEHTSSPSNKSLNSLKKIKKQLDSIVLQRKKDKLSLNELKKNTITISKHIKKTESQLSKHAVNKDLQQIKNNFEEKQSQLYKNNNKLSKELTRLSTLVNRVEHKINTLEKDTMPDKKNVKKTNKSLLKKIKQFEEKLNQFTDTLIKPEYLTTDISNQFEAFSQLIEKSQADFQENDTRIKLLETNTSDIKQLLQQNTDNFQVAAESHQHEIESHQHEIESHQHEVESHQHEIESNQHEVKSHQHEIESHQQIIESQQQDINNNRHSIDDHQHDLDKLQQDINNLQESGAYSQQDIKNQQEYENSIDEKLTSLISRLENMDEHNILLNNQVDKTDNEIQKLQQVSDTLKSELTTQIIEQSLTTLASAQENSRQQITEQLSQQEQTFTQQLEQQHKQPSEHKQKLQDNVSSTEDAQQKLLAPLEIHLKTLEQNIQSLQKEYEKQEQTILNDAENISELSKKINQFNEQLEQSQEEIKEQIKSVLTSAHGENLQQFQQFANTLDALSQQLSGATEQSISLQYSFHSLQQQQKITDEQQDKIAKQVLTQQQQLENHDSQLTQLNPIVAITDSNKQQLVQLTDTVTQLDYSQNKLDDLAQQVNEGHASQQKNISQIVSEQQSQLDSLDETNKTITTRSQLFFIGLMTILVISGLLFYHQDSFNQSLLDNKIDKQKLITQIKTIFNKETDSRINKLEKQNTQVMNQQFNDMKNTLQEVKTQSEDYVLQDDWQKQQQLLQNNMSQTQTEQEKFKQTIAELAETISAMELQIQHLKNISSQASIITGIEAINDSFYTIQLLGALNKDSIISFMKQHNLSETSRIIKTEYNDKPWYILVQGNYNGFSKAQKGLQQLPEFLQKNNPWIKKLP